MFLQVVLMLMLREKAVGSKEKNFFGSNAFHIGDQVQTVFLGQVFDEIESNTTVNFAGRKRSTDVSCIDTVNLMVGVLAARFLKERLIGIHTDRVLEAQMPNRRVCPASDIQTGTAISQFLPHGVEECEMKKSWEGDLEKLE